MRSLLSVQRDPPEGEKAAAAVGGTATKVWWPSLIGKKTAPTADEQAALNDTVTRRSGLSVRSDLKTVPFTAGGVTSTGYQYGGKKATPKTPATDPLHKLALAEFGLGEGGVSAVVTYDRTLSFGAGFADAAAAQWMRDWLDKEPGVEADFAAVGFFVTKGGSWAAVDDAGAILVGEPARQFVRNSPQILSLYMTTTESKAEGESAAQAQQDWIKIHEIDRLPPGLKAEMATWPPGAAASALHLAHWLPAGGPIVSPNRYVGTGGDGTAIAKGFAEGLATTPGLVRGLVGANSAIVIGSTVQTSAAVSHYFAQFGLGAKDAGYLKRAVEASATTLTMSVEDAKTDPALTDHILYLAKAYNGKPKDVVDILDLGAGTVHVVPAAPKPPKAKKP